MAKKKSNKTEEVVEEKKTIWDQIVESVNEENKEAIVEELTSAASFLEESGTDPELLAGFKSTLKRIK